MCMFTIFCFHRRRRLFTTKFDKPVREQKWALFFKPTYYLQMRRRWLFNVKLDKTGSGAELSVFLQTSICSSDVYSNMLPAFTGADDCAKFNETSSRADMSTISCFHRRRWLLTVKFDKLVRERKWALFFKPTYYLQMSIPTIFLLSQAQMIIQRQTR